MLVVKNFVLVVLNLIGELWVSPFRKNAFYDQYTRNMSKVGYIVFVTLSSAVVIAAVLWLYNRIYGIQS